MRDRSIWMRRLWMGGPIGAAAITFGCVTVPAPSHELGAADAALADALSAGAAQFAAADFHAAQQRLNRAHDAYAFNDYAAAHELADEAQAAAELAAVRARAAKATRAADEIEASIRALREEAARRP